MCYAESLPLLLVDTSIYKCAEDLHVCIVLLAKVFWARLRKFRGNLASSGGERVARMMHAAASSAVCPIQNNDVFETGSPDFGFYGQLILRCTSGRPCARV